MDDGNVSLEKSKSHIIVEIVEYIPNALARSTIFKKITGEVTISTFDTGEEIAQKTSLYNIFIQVIYGAAEVFVDEGKKYILRPGNSVIIPAHASHCINANEKFKMISTVIYGLHGFEK
ncbi:MAG: cupin domain-containing protein [Bacteroidia bacterium]|nr:cupin domain-containing protein [Bacteroidia bacterium]